MQLKLILAAAAIAALSVGTITTAQQDGRSTGKIVEGSPADGPEDLKIDIDYPGGTVADYLSELRRVSGYANIIAKPGLDRLDMPKVSLRGVSVVDAILAVQSMTNDRMWVEQNGPILVCLNQFSENAASAAQHPLVTQVWSIERFQPAVSAADVLSSIEAALTVVGGDPTVRYHEETSLIILRGSVDHIDAVNSILNALEQTQSSRERKARMTAEAEMAEIEIQRATAQLTLVLHEHEVANKRLQETKKMIEQGLASESEYLNMELQMHRAATRVDEARADIRKAQIRRESMELQLGKSND